MRTTLEPRKETKQTTRKTQTMEEILNSSRAIPNRYELKASELSRLIAEASKGGDALFFAISKAYQYGFIKGSVASKRGVY